MITNIPLNMPVIGHKSPLVSFGYPEREIHHENDNPSVRASVAEREDI